MCAKTNVSKTQQCMKLSELGLTKTAWRCQSSDWQIGQSSDWLTWSCSGSTMTPSLSIKSIVLRIWTGQLKLRPEKDRQLYGSSSGQTITIVGRGEPELRAGRAPLLAAPIISLGGSFSEESVKSEVWADRRAVTATHSAGFNSGCRVWRVDRVDTCRAIFLVNHFDGWRAALHKHFGHEVQ